MEYKEYKAKSVEEAITKACLDLGITSDRLDYEVVSEGSGGFLGIGSRSAEIKARVRGEEADAAVETAAKAAADVTAAAEGAADVSAAAAAAKDVTAAAEQTSGAASAAAEGAADAAIETVGAISEEDKKQGGRFVSFDEIEQRAAAAAERDRLNGVEAPAENAEDRPYRRERSDRRSFDRRGGRRDDRGYDRRGGRDRNRSRRDFAEEPEHAPSVPKPEREVAPKSEEEVAALTKAAEDFLHEVFEAMGVDVSLSTSYEQKTGFLCVEFTGEDMGFLIGKRGQTLDALQYLTSLVVNKRTDEYIRVKLDTEDYRLRRADALTNLARNIGYKVRKTHRSVALEPMNPYERRIIHSALQGNPNVITYSEGEEPHRYVVVAPKRS